MSKAIMVQGTASGVGKSLLVTGLCRLLARKSLRVAPFKAQNMSLNSGVTRDSREISRAQAVQAQASGVDAQRIMNPILLKPETNGSCQVIIMGKLSGRASARECQNGWKDKFGVVEQAFSSLANQFDVVVIEGQGSPAEINMQEQDLANMKVAHLAKAPVILVGDVERGGVFASLVGTLELLIEEDRQMVAGFVINKLHGDRSLLEKGLISLEKRTRVPCLGVLPFDRQLFLEAEDSLNLAVCQREQRESTKANQVAEGSGHVANEPHGRLTLDVAVLWLPHLANSTDIEPLALEPDVALRYVYSVGTLGAPDLLVIPGSKGTLSDLAYLWESGIADAIKEAAGKGLPILGICGGYQILGEHFVDEAAVEGQRGELPGLGLLPITTSMGTDKVLAQVEAQIIGEGPILRTQRGSTVRGYEIHMGRSQAVGKLRPLFRVRNSEGDAATEGAVDKTGLIIGSYLHGLLDERPLRQAILDFLRQSKGLDSQTAFDFSAFRERQFDRIADLLSDNLDMAAIYRMVG